jgi:hypothetical protein
MKLIERQLCWSPLVNTVQHPFSLVLSKLPPAAFVVLLLAKLDNFPKIKEILGHEVRDTVARNVSMLLIGGSVLFVAWLLYLVRCPTLIRRHVVPETYVSEQIAIGHFGFEPAKIELSILLTDRHPGRQDIDWVQGSPSTLKSSCSALTVKNAMFPSTKEPRTVAYAYWQLQNGIRVQIVGIIWLLMAIGSGIAGWPTIVTFFRVCVWLLSK